MATSATLRSNTLPTAAAVQTLVDVLNDSAAPPSAKVAAATALLDRGWGRPIQQIDAH